MRASTVCMCADVPGTSVILRQLSGGDLRPVHSFQQHEAAPVSQVHARRCTSLHLSPSLALAFSTEACSNRRAERMHASTACICAASASVAHRCM